MILETKLQLPQPKNETLLRSGLLELLKNNLDKKLLLITGGAGYGKTTLLGQLVKEARLPHTFYDLDKNDSDLMVFYAYLVNGLKQIDPGLVKYSQKLLKSAKADGEAGKNVELSFGTLINELYEKRKEELFIILDNYHNIAEDSVVHRALDFFIDRMPDKIHMIISTRSQPPLPSLARWRAKQDLFEISREELAFTGDEIAALLKDVYKIDLSEEDMRQMAKHTEGWITGIRLIMQSKARGDKTIQQSIKAQMEADKPLFEYFANDILSGESEKMQDFLINSSILEVITPGACDSLLDANDSGKVLKRLVKRHLFISSAGLEEYKHHHLFKEFLQGQLKGRTERESLHEKAALYYEKRGVSEQVIHHLLEAGRFDLAAKGIVNISREMFDRGRITKLTDWLGKMPEDMIDGRGELLLIKAAICRERGCLREANDLFFKAESAVIKMARRGKMSSEQRAIRSLALHGQARMLRMKTDYAGAIETLNTALRFCPASNEDMKGKIYNSLFPIWQVLGDYKKAKACMNKARVIALKLADSFNLMSIEHNIAWQNQQMGEIKTAVSMYKSLYDRITKNYFYGASAFFVNAAASAIALGEHDWAENCLAAGRRLAAAYTDESAAAKFDNCSGLLYTCRGQWEKAFQCLDKARQGLAASGMLEGEITTLRNLARLFRCQGNNEKADEYLSQAQKKNAGAKGGIGMGLITEKALIDSSCGRLAEAEKGIRAGMVLARKRGAQLDVFHLDLAMAAVKLKQEKEHTALRILSKAIETSRLKGYDGILIRELRHNPALAELAFNIRTSKEYLEMLKPEITAAKERAPEGIDFMARLFGAVQISLPRGRELPLKWPSRKEASLFSYLLLHRGRICNIEELVKAFWPNAPLKRAEQDIYNMISRVKKTLRAAYQAAGVPASRLRSVIVREGRGYRLSPDYSYWVDAEEFYRAYKKARQAEQDGNKTEARQCLQKCIELYRDGFLCNLGEFWVEGRREEYEKIYLLAAQKLADYCLESGDCGEAERFIRACLEKDPNSEENHVKLWHALKAQGRTGDIHGDYKDLKKALKKYLGEAPCEGTDKTYHELTAPAPRDK